MAADQEGPRTRSVHPRRESTLSNREINVEPLALRPLTPAPISDQHDLYSRELVALLRSEERRKDVRNIALSGSYGSGKSSVLAAVKAELEDRVVEVSLASLSDIGVQPDASEDELNNHIQKEIVKQLLYRERPNKVSGSRFRRISRLPFWRTIAASALAGVVVAGILWLTGWGAPFRLAADHGSGRVWLFVTIGAASAAISFLLQFLLHNRVRIDKLGTAATSVSLKTEGLDEEGSFFDKYLDEIVYFFEMTKHDVVIIEDLDRFKNPAIYASLRALNTVLNTSRQLRRRPVHFIYAVRDSIFEDLIKAPKRAPGEQDKSATAGLPPSDHSKVRVWQADRKLSDPATQRAKFFDLVIPIVPFITYRTSRDLLVPAMKEVDPAVASDVIGVVAKHITDMRLLRNIVNEYRVFKSRVLEPNKLLGLTPDGLFAMVAFKNTRLEDFELIRVGDSSLDRLYRVSRKIIDAELEGIAGDITALEDETSPVAETQARATQLSGALQAIAERWMVRLNHSKQNVRFKVGNQFVAPTSIETPEFWAGIVDENKIIEVWSSSNIDVFHIDANGLREELGGIVPVNWAVKRGTDWHEDLKSARAYQRWLRSADFRQLTQPKRPLKLDDQPVDFRAAYLDPLGDPLLIELIAEGHIDRNFHLYTSEYHGEVTSANAMNFVIQHVQAEVPSHRYKLDRDEITAVLKEGGPEALGSVGLFNLAVYDKMLDAPEELFERNIRLLSWARPAGIDFIDTYIAAGQHKEELFRRLARHWPDVFVYIANLNECKEEERAAFSLAAFEGADPNQEYPAPGVVRNYIATGYERLVELTAAQVTPTRAIRLLQQIGVRLPSLSGLSPKAIDAIIEARQYLVTAENLQIALKDPEDIGLDTVFRASDQVFAHVISHFDDYLSALDSSDPPAYPLKDLSTLVDIMAALERVEPGKSLDILARLSESALVEDLSGVPTNVMSLLAQGQRFALGLSNIDAYVAEVSFDEHLARYLENAGSVPVQATEPAEQEKWAVRILNEPQIAVPARLTLAMSITQTPLPITKITTREPEVIRSLVEKSMVADDPSTFAALEGSVPCQVAFLLGSREAITFFSQLTPSAAVLQQLLSHDSVDDSFKRHVALDVPRLAGHASQEVLEEVAKWSVSAGEALPPDTLQLVQSSAIALSSKIGTLNLSAPSLASEAVIAYVQLLPEPYSRLLQLSSKPVDLPVEPNFDEVLRVIRADGTGPVSTWRKIGEGTRVWMRRTPSDD